MGAEDFPSVARRGKDADEFAAPQAGTDPPSGLFLFWRRRRPSLSLGIVREVSVCFGEARGIRAQQRRAQDRLSCPADPPVVEMKR